MKQKCLLHDTASLLPARTDGRAVEPPYTAVQAADVGSVIQAVTGLREFRDVERELQVVPSHFPEMVRNIYCA